ncbi:MAG: succinate dehydrogenase assembly factor 2 [Gammaproteobacteria bacterium]
MIERSRLLWRCRRGLRELDLILEKFLAQHYADLSLKDKQLFDEFLDHSDDDLLSWLIGRSQPSNTAMARLVAQIRDASTI